MEQIINSEKQDDQLYTTAERMKISLSQRYSYWSSQKIPPGETMLTELMHDLLRDTEIFVYNLSVDEKDVADKMRADYVGIVKSIKRFEYHHENKEKMKELKQLWKIADSYFGYEGKEDKKKRKKVLQAKEWFLHNSNFHENDNDWENIFNSFKKVGKKWSQTNTFLVLKTIKLLDDNFDNWKRQFYTYDNDKKCDLIFFNGEYYVDHFGNFFLDRDSCFRFLWRLNGFVQFNCEEEEPFYVTMNLNEELLQDSLKAFKFIGKGFAFQNFVNDTKHIPSKAVHVLLQMKAFCSFFCHLDEFSFPRIYFGIKNSTIIMSSLDLQSQNIDTVRFFNGIEKSCLNMRKNMQETNPTNFFSMTRNAYPTMMLSKTVLIKDSLKKLSIHLSPNDMNTLQRDLTSHITKADQDFINICCLIAQELIQHVKKKPLFSKWILAKQLTAFDIKYIIYWVATKWESTEEAITKFSVDGDEIKKEFCRLMMAVIKCQKSKNHKFFSKFSAAYHFEKHYTTIRDILNNSITASATILPTLPELNKENLRECAECFFSSLVDFIFEGEGILKADDNNSYEFYCFEKLRIRGMKFKKKTIPRQSRQADLSCSNETYIYELREVPEPLTYQTIQMVEFILISLTTRFTKKRKASN